MGVIGDCRVCQRVRYRGSEGVLLVLVHSHTWARADRSVRCCPVAVVVVAVVVGGGD